MSKTCTILQPGRNDTYGRPLLVGQVYTGPDDEVFSLWQSGFATVNGAPESFNSPQTFGVSTAEWQCGIPFWMPAGDGGANGLIFDGIGTGVFTLSSAITANLILPSFYAYLPADAAYSGSLAGWYYGTMNTSTTGVLYANTYDISTGVQPFRPVSPVALPVSNLSRLTQAVTEITCCQKDINPIGKNGYAKVDIRTFSTITAGSKTYRLRIGSTAVHANVWTTANNNIDTYAVIANAGSESSQICTRTSLFGGGISGSATYNSDISAVDMSSKTQWKFTMQISANTEHFVLIPRAITTVYGA